MTTDGCKTGRQNNHKVEVNIKINSIANYDYNTITNDHYLPPPPPPQRFQLNKARVKKLKALLMSKVNPTISKKYALLENVKEVIRDAKTFTVEYSSEIVDVTVVTNKVNQIQK